MFCMHNQLPSEHFLGQKKHEMNRRMESQPPEILGRLWGFKGELGPFVVSAGTLVPAACLFMKKLQRLKSFERLMQMNGCQMAWFIMVGMISFFNRDIRLHHVMFRHYHKHLVRPCKITFSQCNLNRVSQRRKRTENERIPLLMALLWTQPQMPGNITLCSLPRWQWIFCIKLK